MPGSVKRFDVLDGSYRVLLRGTSPSDILPIDPLPLEPRLEAELAATLEHHDFDRRPVATGLFGEEFSWRVAQVAGRDYFALLLERNGLGRRTKRFGRNRGMSQADTAFLRLLVGGYEPREIARRTGESVSATIARRSALVLSLGYRDTRALVRAIAGEDGEGAQQFELLQQGGLGILGKVASGS